MMIHTLKVEGGSADFRIYYLKRRGGVRKEEMLE